MKSLLIIIIFLSGSAAFSQTQIINSMPEDGIVLNSGWKFQAGDNPEWAKQNYDDIKWTHVELSNYNTYLPQFKTKNIGWFRLNLLIDSAIQKKQLAIQMSQLGASEIYLNGKLFQQLGFIEASLDYKSFNPVDKPLLLPFTIGDSIVIAIRFASEVPSRIWLFSFRNKLPLTVRINSWSNAFDTYEANVKQARILVNQSYLFVPLALLFILLYAFFTKEKVNLLFGGLSLFAATYSLLSYKLSQGSLSISQYGLVSYLQDSNGIIEGTLVLSIISLVVFNRIAVFVWLIFFIFIIDSLRFLFFGDVFFAFVFTVHVAVTATFLYLSIPAFRRRKYIIGIVALNSCVINLYFFFPYFHVNWDVEYFLASIMMANFIMITLYLAINFARKSKNLEVQLVEIEKLSKDNLKKERERQQLLASQNETLEEQVQERTTALKKSLEELKSTQSQLIQSEKMASLGELTAGIAHEIQNPLNFVNNFSEVNKELVGELQTELKAGNTEEAIAISNDIKENEEKINHHGRRADDIVKGMLLHSRKTSGQKEPTDINALADEYLRLSYHGMRAKDKSFNATLNTDFDEHIGKINIIPTDVSRVLLNLYNNAFYAVNEKAKQQPNGYEPTITVSTKHSAPSPLEKGRNAIILTVKDNGNGISSNIVDKIFQPFFTTKPTGQGTGLGLSLSYDIIKAHGGEIMVETKETEGTEFKVILPVN